jgi:hypothetical protein
MPNWCAGSLFVKHPEDKQDVVKKFFDELNGADDNGNTIFVDFNKLIPIPSNAYWGRCSIFDFKDAEYMRRHNLIDGHTWCLSNWGVRSQGDCEPIDDNSMSIWTAWGPPTNIIDKIWEIAQKYGLHMEFDYEEPAMQVCGAFENGEWTDYAKRCDLCKKCDNWLEIQKQIDEHNENLKKKETEYYTRIMSEQGCSQEEIAQKLVNIQNLVKKCEAGEIKNYGELTHLIVNEFTSTPPAT